IQKGKPVEIHLSLTGANNVGIECSPDVWRELTNGADIIRARLLSSNKKDTQIGGISPNSDYHLWGIESWHYLFYVAGEYHAKAAVEITFPNAPPAAIHADIIVGKTPADFGL